MNQTGVGTGTQPPLFFALFAGFASLFIGVGLARFGYTPLLPAVIEAGWFPPGEAAYLGAANYAGYLVGAVFAWRLPVPLSPRTTLRVLLACTVVSFAASSLPLSFEWMAFWRFLPGLTGGWIMVLSAPLVLTAIPAARQGLAGGIFFTGVAGGIIASGTLIPPLLSASLEAAWLGIAALMALVLAIAWRGIPAGEVELSTDSVRNRRGISPPMLGLVIAYALFAFGITAHMLFFVDYVARGMGQGIRIGSLYWIVIGAAGLAGPILAAAAARRLGTRPFLLFGYLGLAGGGAIAAISPGGLLSALLSAVLVGGLLTALSAMTLAMITETIASQAFRTRIWGIATATFAVAQAAAAYAYSRLFDLGYPYSVLFFLSATASALGFLAIWVSGRVRLSR